MFRLVYLHFHNIATSSHLYNDLLTHSQYNYATPSLHSLTLSQYRCHAIFTLTYLHLHNIAMSRHLYPPWHIHNITTSCRLYTHLPFNNIAMSHHLYTLSDTHNITSLYTYTFTTSLCKPFLHFLTHSQYHFVTPSLDSYTYTFTISLRHAIFTLFYLHSEGDSWFQFSFGANYLLMNEKVIDTKKNKNLYKQKVQ